MRQFLALVGAWRQCHSMSGDFSAVRVFRELPGRNGMKNDVLYHPAANPKSNESSHVVYFGGDVQDYDETMANQPQLRPHRQWSLERTATLLSNKFPRRHVWVVKPAVTELVVFSVFCNFMDSERLGEPRHFPGQRSWCHLAALLRSALGRAGLGWPPADVTLVGFSKGCTVLNQLVYDVRTAEQEGEATELLQVVREIVWLDGGHNGKHPVWVTDDVILQSLRSRDIRLRSHVTPYQTRDKHRPWIGGQQETFVQKLAELGADIVDRHYHTEAQPSLENHFILLQDFSAE